MRLRLPRSVRPPLSRTLLTTALLLALPAALLLAFPRRAATGLERLMPSAALLQSFPAQATADPPLLWRQRLGPAGATRLWAAQRSLWWQFWGAHGDAGAYLVLSAPPSVPLPAHALRVDDLIVVAPDPLARQLLDQELRIRRRAPRGLAARCMQSLRQSQAVHWNAGALAQILGPLAPLAQDLQQGCLVLGGERRALLWQGEADASEGSMAPPPPALPPAPLQPLASPQLLELRGRRLELLLRGLLASPLLRQSLAQTYGLNAAPLALLQRSSFQLRLRSVPSGAFQAALELQVQPPAAEGAAAQPLLNRWLNDLGRPLRDQGLEPSQPGRGITTWSREDGTVVGGWRWLADRQLLLFLGPVPDRLPESSGLTADWRLRLRPDALASIGLLPPSVPPVVRRSQQLSMLGQARGQRSGERQSAISGRLDLR